MIPNKELAELVRALTQTTEYTEMMRARKKAMENMQIARQMSAFERENMRLRIMNLSEAERTERVNKLYADYAPLLEREDVKGFTAAVRQYQKVVSESIAYLTRQLDMNSQPRTF
jgi:hypothetical protein